MTARRLLPTFALACLRAAAADLSGHWTFEGDVVGNPVKLECDLRQDGSKLEGTCKTREADVKISGEVNDPKVRFSYATEHDGNIYTLYYSGALDSAAGMKGEIQVSGVTGTFTGRKEPAK
jgi:hypothetical protein